MRTYTGLLVAVVAIGGCAAGNKNIRSGAIVQQYQQGRNAGKANVYWFETPAGAVVVDVPLTISDAKKLKDGMVKPYRIYITAAKPERFGSLATMKIPDVPAYTTPAIATEIQNHGNTRLQPFRRSEGSDVPAHVEPPVPAVEERTHDMVGEVEVDLIPLGPAESESSLALFLPKTGELIAGDVVAGGDHVDLTWGRSVVWQDRIAELKTLEPKHVYPGHGAVGGPELLDQTLEYLKYFHDTIAEKVKPGAPAKITPADLADCKKKLIQRFQKLGRTEILDKSIPAEYAVQLAALPPAPPPDPVAAPAPGGTPAPGAPATAPKPATTTTTPAPTQAPAAKPASSPGPADDLLSTPTPESGKKKKKK
jgi:glyoxylase-like metal-dependent hydrolase (beta-lactamase superfamily II)